MGEHSKPEWNLLLPVGLMVLFPFIRSQLGFDAINSAFLIAAVPLVVFPAILILGQIYKGEEWWKHQLKEGGIIALAALAITLSLTVWLIVEFLGHHGPDFGSQGVIFDWIQFEIFDGAALIGTSTLSFGLWIDSVSLTVLFVAAFLCFLICWFAIGYMTTDPINEDRNHRFFAEFVLFSMGMFGMVLADSFLWLFIFWEIMGLCSYLLIGFYWEKPSAAAAAKKAFLTTRVGDVFLMVGLFMLYDLYHSLEFAVIFGDPTLGGAVHGTDLQWPLFLMFIGCVGKSAQFPLHVWLPDAMEGPTPVSALIHAATMVNAGLYLVARMFPLFSEHHFEGDLSDLAMLIAWIGGITACMAAFIAFVANDIKRVLAYSTMSQLAYIFTGLGAACWFANQGYHHLSIVAFGAALFHLFNHAMAKGMLFMASGSVIHEMHHAHDHVHLYDDDGHHDFDPQDMRNMGGLASKMPITSIAMMLGSMSIIGIPLIGGFWSKEGIVGQTWNVYAHGGEMILFPAILVLATAGMTGFYMSRMWFMTFAGKPKSDVVEHVHEDTQWIKTPLVVLSIVTAFSGFILACGEFAHWLGDPDHTHFMTHLIEHPGDAILHELEIAFLPDENLLKIVGWTAILLSAGVGPFIAARMHGGKLADGEEATPLTNWLISYSGSVGHTDVGELATGGFATALHNRLYIDDAYEWVISRTLMPLAAICAWIDKNWVDGVIKGIESGSQSTSTWLRQFTTGRASDYLLMATVGMLIIVGILWGVA
ncbi:MAG TPA: NADH-quinone oxidoreductase subunit L [Candidatus Thalassarchaeaceae archaeon]|nr:NADH-quinone oxidoreductase subunit L [Candidatus Thalassarchaeaceae archaeon]